MDNEELSSPPTSPADSVEAYQCIINELEAIDHRSPEEQASLEHFRKLIEESTSMETDEESSKRKRTIQSDESEPSTEDEDDNDGFITVRRRAKTAPIFVYGQESFGLTNRFNRANLTFTATSKGHALKFKFQTPEHYREAIHILDGIKAEYHSFLLKEEKDVKLVIRGLPRNTSCDSLREAISLKGYKVKHLTQLKLSGKPSPLFLVYFDPTGINNDFKNITEINKICVTVEPFRGRKGPPQCFRCQRYGHSSAVCKSPLRCVACGENHDVKQCLKDKNSSATCCNCHGEHPANYRGCDYYKNLTSKAAKPTTHAPTVRQRTEPKPEPPVPQMAKKPPETRSYADALVSNKRIVPTPTLTLKPKPQRAPKKPRTQSPPVVELQETPQTTTKPPPKTQPTVRQTTPKLPPKKIQQKPQQTPVNVQPTTSNTTEQPSTQSDKNTETNWVDRILNSSRETLIALRSWATDFLQKLDNTTNDSFKRLLVIAEAITSCPIDLSYGY